MLVLIVIVMVWLCDINGLVRLYLYMYVCIYVEGILC